MSEYIPKEIEAKWQKFWETNKTFATPRLPATDKKYYCLDMFPYPSGTGLHVGHPLGYTATDIVSRYKRMCGYSVLHPMGFDAFGLPAEQHAIKTGEHPSTITIKNCAVFSEQLKRVGLSYDWDRELATCTADYYRWTQWIFLQIYNSWFDESVLRARPISELPIPSKIKEQGTVAVQRYQDEHRLAYYSDAMVNWCPGLGTVLANEEVIDGKSERGGFDVIRKPMKQWMMRITKYSERLLNDLAQVDWPESIKEQQRNWIGRKPGAEIRFRVAGSEEFLTAFTTRPDTLFGATFFVVSPEHPIVSKATSFDRKDAVEQYQKDAAALSDIQRTMDNRKKTGVFTGSFVVNPINQREIPLYVGDYVLATVGTGAVMGVPAHDERDFEFARMFNIDVRTVVLPSQSDPAIYRAALEGEMAWTEPGVMACIDDPVAKELGLAGESNLDAAQKIVEWLEKHKSGRAVVNYKLRDWVFSRQRFWGEPIPIVHWEDGTVTPLSAEELPLELPDVVDYQPSESGESPLARVDSWVNVTGPDGKRGRRETNTMPNWAGSCWYYLRFIDPKNSNNLVDREAEKAWMPVDLYVGGAEHAVLHLLYARFWHKVLFDLGHLSTNEPFGKLYNQGMIQAFAYRDSRGALVPVDEVEEQGVGVYLKRDTQEKVERIVAKMSKSLRNVASLDTIISEFGVDTFRTYLMFMGPLDASRPWDTKAVMGNFRFLKRFWSFLVKQDGSLREFIPAGQESKEVKRAINFAVQKVTQDLDTLQFNTAISTMMECLNVIGDQPVSQSTATSFVLILSPFAPHIAEELWQKLGHKESLAYADWPSYDPATLVVDVVPVVIQVKGKKRALVEVSPAIAADDLKRVVIETLSKTEYQVSESNKFITVFLPDKKTPRLVNVV